MKRKQVIQLKKFRERIVKMIQDLRKRMKAQIKKIPKKMFNKDLEELNKNQC